jgi:hypothetical protein
MWMMIMMLLAMTATDGQPNVNAVDADDERGRGHRCRPGVTAKCQQDIPDMQARHRIPSLLQTCPADLTLFPRLAFDPPHFSPNSSPFSQQTRPS